MPVHLTCCSHSPLMQTGIEETQGDAQARFRAAMDDVARELDAFAPDLVLSFGPDHFNGFFYDLMPPFCIGVVAEGLRDWGMQGGPLRVPKALALDCVRELHRRDFDISISYDMKIDHGATVSLMQLTGALDRFEVLPVFINCAADPRPSLRRVRALGTAIGEFLATRDLRVAVIGSGGLSHDPPTPRLDRAPPEVAARLIKRAVPGPDDLAAREARVLRAARDMLVGKGPCMPPDPQWDAAFMRKIEAFDAAALDRIDDAELDRQAGFGGHEVRTWVAASAAAQALAGPAARLTPRERFCQVIPEWLTGMGVLTATA
ncbi:MAG: 3-carboxyethylcatechol 2,3-dioxygenase [Betaproteobacteria bacterium]